MTELTQQAFDRISELAKNAIKERDVAIEALARCEMYFSVCGEEGRRMQKVCREAINFRAEGDGQ